MQTFENLLLQNYLTEFLDITPCVCVILVCSNSGATYIASEIISLTLIIKLNCQAVIELDHLPLSTS